MDLQWLITFQTILETGSYTKAAEKLGYTQSTITSQIQQLEQELSVKLFEKIGRRMNLTEAGQQALPQINQITTLLAELKTSNDLTARHSGHLNISVEETLLVKKMGIMLPEYLECVPGMDIHIVISQSCEQVREALKAGDLDIGILYKDPADQKYDPMLVETPVTKIPLVLVGSNYHEVPWDMEKGVPTTQHTVYLNDPKCIFHGMYKRYLDSKDIPIDCIVSLGNTNANLDFIENGRGITYIPKYVVKDRLKSGRLQELYMDTSENTAYITYAVHKNKWISPAIKLFIDLFKRYVADLELDT